MIAAVNGLIAKLGERERLSPSVPLDAPDPSASIVYTDQEYDALSERLEAPPLQRAGEADARSAAAPVVAITSVAVLDAPAPRSAAAARKPTGG